MDTLDQTAIEPDELVARARALAPMLRDRAQRVEDDRRVADDTIEAIREAGIFRVLQPRAFGGLEGDWRTVVRISDELSAGCGSTGWVAGLIMAHQWLLANFPMQAQHDVWDGNPAVGIAGSYAPAGRVEKADGGYRITGEWRFTSGCDVADWSVMGAMVPPDQDGGPPTASFLLAPRADYVIEDDWFAMGLAGTGSKTLVCDGAFVPEHRKVSFADISLGTSPGAAAHGYSLYRIPFLSCLPVCIGTPPLGMLRGAIEDFREAARTRGTRGAIAGGGSKLAEFAAVQTSFAEASIALDSAMLLFHRDLQEVADVAARGEQVSVDLRIRNRLTQAYAVRLAVQGIQGLFDASGGAGIYLDNNIQRRWRDINAAARHIAFNWAASSTMYGQNAFGLEPMGQY